MNMNKLKPNNIALYKKEYNFSSNEIEQATLFKCAKMSHGYTNQHQKQAFP